MQPFLRIWVGPAAAARSFGVGEIILAGVWINSLASIPFAQLQGQARPQVVATFHLIELVPFLAVLWIGIRAFGLGGAAGAWTLRVTIDAMLLFWAAGYGWALTRALSLPFLLVAGSCASALLIPVASPLGWVIGLVLCLLSIGWALSFESPARAQAMRLVHRFGHAVRRP